MTLINIFLIGDSTMSNYDASEAPRAGWGQALGSMLPQRVRVHNKAASGRSSKSFINEGRLAQMEEQLTAGDLLLIQFGHNDEKDDEERHTEPYTTYKSYLKIYIDMAINKGAIPILITPVQRRSFDVQGNFQDTHGEYPQAMKQLAEECKVRIIDLALKSKQLLERLGSEQSQYLFLWLKTGEHPNYPNGSQDNTHFCTVGAIEIAKLVLEGINELGMFVADGAGGYGGILSNGNIKKWIEEKNNVGSR
jgi:lysophospholipase L1-like esterase